MFKNLAVISMVFMLFSCASTEEKKVIKGDIFAELGRDLDNANNKIATDSQWLSGRGVKLNVIGPIYSSNANSQSRANLILDEVLSELLSSSERMSQKTKIDFKQHFSSIEQHSYNSGDPKFTYIPALVTNAFADEAALNAVLETTIITRKSGKENAEIGFYLDEMAWKNKIILLSGYKTIKVEGKSRSSNWFRLKQKMPEQATVVNVKNALAHMLVFALNSSLREYASVDRGKVMSHSNYEFIVERVNGNTSAYIYRDRKKLLAREQRRRLESLDKERVILNSSGVVDIDLEENLDKLLLIRNENYLSKVELVSTQNSTQRTLIFESNSWDEQVLKAYYYSRENRTVIITDKRILFFNNRSHEIEKSVSVDNAKARFVADKSRALLFRLENNRTQQFNAHGRELSVIKLKNTARDFVLSGDNKYLVYLFQNYSLSMLSLKTGRWDDLTTLSQEAKHLQQCKAGIYSLAYQDNRVIVIENKPQSTLLSHQFNEPIKNIDCDDEQNKMLVLLESGAVIQVALLDPSNKQIDFSMLYSGFDKQNSHYVGHYLAGDEFIYGGRDNLRIRSSVSADEVNGYYAALDNKVNISSSWLDQAVIDQAIYVMDINQQDKRLYQLLIDQQSPINIKSLRDFMMEEALDPILMSNQTDGFNNLGLSLQVSEEKGLRIVKEISAPIGDGLSASKPSLEILGYNVNIVELGQYGFEAGIYNTFSSTGMTDLTANILNVDFSDDGKVLLLARTDGVLSLKQLRDNQRISMKLNDDGIRAAAINKANDLLVIATDKGVLKIYDISYDFYSTEDPIFTLKKEVESYAGNINSIQFLSDNQVLTSGKDQIIKVWDLDKGKVFGTEMLGHTDTIISSFYDPSLSQIISSSKDNTVRVWDIASHEQLFSFKGKGAPFVTAIDEDANAVAYTNGANIEVKNLVTRDTLGRISVAQKDLVQAINLGMNANTLYVAYQDRIEVIKVSTGVLLATITYSEPLILTKMLIDADYQNLILVEKGDIHMINIGRFKLESLRIQ